MCKELLNCTKEIELRNRGKFLCWVQCKWKTKRRKWPRGLRKRKNIIMGNDRLYIVLGVMKVTMFSVKDGTANTCSGLQPLVIRYCDTTNRCMSPVWNLNMESSTYYWIFHPQRDIQCCNWYDCDLSLNLKQNCIYALCSAFCDYCHVRRC